ncbi:MAG TPA: serpin family protein [Longimicrobiales bacterium]|nr:serpin family protein [Longimicrobiales bacterium]
MLRLHHRRVALTAMMMVALTACAGSIIDPRDSLPPPRALTADEIAISDASTGFGFELLRRVHAAAEEPNVLLSPLSASMALGMAMNGATGETYAAMKATLGFGGMSEEEVNLAYRGLIDQLRVRDRNVEFRLANSAWLREGFPFEQAFLDAARTYFDAEVESLDFGDPGSPRIINEWVDDVTGGRITEIVDQIDPLDILFLVNAVYFRAPWSSPFEPLMTHPAQFHTIDGRTVTVPTMGKDGAVSLHQDDEVVVVDLPYAEGDFSMTIIMPAVGRSIDDLIDELTPERWTAWTGQFAQGRVILRLPKFKFEFDEQLVPALAEMGMGRAFDANLAEFDRITTARNDVYISAVRQAAYIDVHELGTEAAAATSVTVGVTSMPPEIRIDRPFVFAIRARESNTLLFLGRVGDPSS